MREIILFLPPYYPNRKNAPNKVKLRRIFTELNDTLRAKGIDSQTMCITEWNHNVFCKVSVCVGGSKAKMAKFKGKHGEIIGRMMEHQQISGNRHVVVESGYIHNRENYWSVGWDGLNGRANFCNKNMDDSRIKKWGINLTPWKNNSEGFVLFCLQIPWDAAIYHADYPKYIKATVGKILSSTNRDIVLREHPLINKSKLSNSEVANKYRETLEEILSNGKRRYDSVKSVYKSENKDVKSDFDKSWCVVAFNSNSTVEAAIYGIPSFVADVGSMTWDISSHNLDIENPIKPDRYQWLCDLSYAQWNADEIIQGQPFKQLGILK